MRTFEKILIIRFSSLGDIILATPLFRVLRKIYPEAQIDVIVKSEYADVVKFNPNISSVIELKTSEYQELRWLKQKIRRIKYDLVIDIHNSLRSRYLRWFSNARKVKVVNKKVVARFLLVQLKWNFYRGFNSVTDRYFRCIKNLEIYNDGNGLEIFLPDDTKNTVATIMERYRLKNFEIVLGIVPTSRHFTKKWLPERFIEFGIEFSRKYRSKIFIFGSKYEHDYCDDIAQMINTRLGSSTAESFAGRLNLLETAQAFDFCNLLVTNDSGLMHLAAARGKKIVAIFGSTVREFGFFPYGDKNIVVERKDLSCRPCSHVGLSKCPREHFRCMKDIQVHDVLASVGKILS